MIDYSSYCEMFYAAHYLPIAMYDENGFVCASGFYEDGDPYPFLYPKLKDMNSPAVYVSSDTGYYGMIASKNSNYCFILGPAYSTPVTDDFVRLFMRKNTISVNRYSEIDAFLSGIPQYTYNQFLNLLLYLHYSITGEKKDLTKAFGLTDTDYQQQIGQQHSEKAYVERENQQKHGTYYFEQQMLELIKNGDSTKLEQFLLSAASIPNMNEGKLAETPLRQAKNLFIGLVTVVGKFSAIPGGLDIEQTYQLIDTYIQECEKLQTEEAVKNLQYNMPIDFAKRVEQQKLPAGISPEIYSCIQFISTHVNEPISSDDVVDFSGKSRAYLFKKFGQELNMNIGAYIMHCRLREAKSLLRYTDKSLSEISNYLCFSSQAYFQNVFKSETGMTPKEYRKKKRVL